MTGKTRCAPVGAAPSRVRLYYCCASADTDATSELARLEFQPRRAYRTAGSESADLTTPAPAPSTAPTPAA